MPEVVDALPVVPLGTADWGEAARLLEQAVKAGNHDQHAVYLLAMCYKHLGRSADARQMLERIAHADANVFLQRGILAFAERDYDQAAQAFDQSWEQDSASYPAAYNLLLARLALGQYEPCIQIIPKIIPLTEVVEKRRFLAVLRALLMTAPAATEDGVADQREALGSMSAEEERLLADFLSGLGSFDVAYRLLSQLIAARPRSKIAYGAYFGAALLQGKLLMDRFHWDDAYALLAALARTLEDGTPPPVQRSAAPDEDGVMQLVGLHTMLGTCSCMLQDHERGVWYFRIAQETFYRARGPGAPLAKKRNGSRPPETHLTNQDTHLSARLEQNLALANEWQNKLEKAETHWNRYFDGLEQLTSVTPAAAPYEAATLSSSPPCEREGSASDITKLAFEGASRLADLYIKREKWSAALGFLQRAQRLRPVDNDVLERLFHLYTQLKKNDEAKRILRRLRELRPNDAQVELFEMDVRDFRLPDDIDKTLGDVRRVLQNNPGDMRVEERAGSIINNMVPALERLGEQYTSQINKVIEQMRRLPSYQINWPLVRNVMRELEDKFFQLRRVAQKCLALLTSDDLRRDINSLVTHCDRKIDQCHSLGE